MLRSNKKVLRSVSTFKWRQRTFTTSKLTSARVKVRKGQATTAFDGEDEVKTDSCMQISDHDQSDPVIIAKEQPKTRKRVSKLDKACSDTVPASVADASATSALEQKCSTRSATKSPIFAPRLVQASEHHNSLSTFLAYAARVNLKTTTNLYKGTLYEYTVATALKSHGFTLHRTGRSNDLGIDTVGYWKLPGRRTKARPVNELKVVVQCKATKPQPSMVRELEGAYAGAPAGWRGEGVLALLASSKEATKGVRAALQRSRWPMGVMQVTADGELKQFLWNAVAAHYGLEGLGVTVRYGDEKDSEVAPVESSIALTWLGRPQRALAR